MPTRIDALSPSADWDEVRHWRKLVRDDLIQRRTALPSDIRRRLGESACARLVEAADLRAFVVLGFCWPIRGEFDVRGIAKEYLASGGQLALPVVVQRSAPVEFWRWHPGMRMQTGVWNIPIPKQRDILTPDAVIVPLVGLPVQSVSKVPDWGFGGRYHIDFLGMPFRASPSQLAVENFREIKGQILKTALSPVNARPSRIHGVAVRHCSAGKLPRAERCHANALAARQVRLRPRWFVRLP